MKVFWACLVAIVAVACVAWSAMPHPHVSYAAHSVSASVMMPPPHRRLLSPVAQTRQFAVPVLMYHHICALTPQQARDPLMRDLSVSPANFAQQVGYLRQQGFTFLTTPQVETALREHAALPVKSVAITLDDGYQDAYTVAYPILRRFGARATVFVVTDTLGTPGHLSWTDVQAMRPWVASESHTVHHWDLTQLSPAQRQEELDASRQALKARLGARVTDIAYPSGAYNAAVLADTHKAGYQAGWQEGNGPVMPGDPLLHLPRIRVRGSTNMVQFAQKVWSGVAAERVMGAVVSSHCFSGSASSTGRNVAVLR